MTVHRNLDVLRALGACTFLPGHPHKRFVRQINQAADHDATNITWRQWAHVHRLAWRYRRQMPAHLIPPRKPNDPPPRPPKRPRKPRGSTLITFVQQPQMEIELSDDPVALVRRRIATDAPLFAEVAD